MTSVKWGSIGNCTRCGKKATTYFEKVTFFRRIDRYFCQDCLLEVLREQKLEKTKLKGGLENEKSIKR